MADHLVTINAISNGGYCDKSIRLELTNNTKKDLAINVDPGLIFVPEDTAYQNLVLLGNESLVLKSGFNPGIDLQTFCGKSYAHSPHKNIRYHFWKQGDSNMVKMLTYVRNNNIDIHLAQSAVWTFTNGHCLNTVYSALHMRMSEDFVKYIAFIKHQKVPKFYTEYKTDNSNDRPVFTTEHEKTIVNVHWTDGAYRHMYVTVYKGNGDVYKNIEADRVIDKYGYTVMVQFDPMRDPKGMYIVRLHDDENKVWEEKKVYVGANPCDMM